MNLIPQQLPLPQSPNTQFIDLIPQQLPPPPITEHTIYKPNCPTTPPYPNHRTHNS